MKRSWLSEQKIMAILRENETGTKKGDLVGRHGVSNLPIDLTELRQILGFQPA